jgi:serine/threonine-protein kinase
MQKTTAATLMLSALLAACDDTSTTNGADAARDTIAKSRDVSPDDDQRVVPPVDEGVPADLAPTIDVPQGIDLGAPIDRQEAIDRPAPVDIAATVDVADVGASGRTVPVGRCGARRGLYFPESTWIYTDITRAPVRSDSSATTAWLEARGGWGNGNRFQIDTSFVILDAEASTPRVARTTSDPVAYSSDCDPNVMMPIPTGGRLEGQAGYICPGRVMGDYQGDCHMLVVDVASNRLFEAFRATYSGGRFYSECTVAWNTTRDVWGVPPAPGSTLPPVSVRNWGIGRDCTGPDAAGFPIAPLLFTIGDVMSGRVEHAIRFALPNARMQRAATSSAPRPVYVWPATHAGGPQAVDPAAPIYGSRWRLRAGFNPASRGLDATNPVVRAVVYGLQHYGMLLSDGGEIALMAEDSAGCGTSWETLFGDRGTRVLHGIRPSDFEVLDTGGTEAGYDCMRNPAR